MTKEELQTRADACKEKFDQLAAQRDELEDELKRLQGEYRGYQALVNEFPEAAKEAPKKEKK